MKNKTKKELLEIIDSLQNEISASKNRDIEAESIRSEGKYKSLYDDSLVALLRVSALDGIVLHANKAASRLFDFDNVDDFVNNFSPAERFVHSDDKERVSAKLENDKFLLDEEVQCYKKDGSKIWISTNQRLVESGNYVEVALFDISYKKGFESLKQCHMEISGLLGSNANIDELFVALADTLKGYIDDVKIGIGMMDTGVNMLFFPFFEDSSEDEYTIISTEDSDNLASDVVKYKDTIYFDKNHLARFYQKNMTTPKGTLPNFWLGIPILMEDDVLGVIVVQRYTSTKSFTIDEVDLFTNIANQLASVISRKSAEEEIQMVNKSLEEKVFERTSQLEDAAEEIRFESAQRLKAQNELQLAKDELEKSLESEKELSELKTRFVAVVSHEYRTPLTVIMLATDIMEICFASNLKQEFDKNIFKIRASVRRMSGLLEDVLIYGRSTKKKLDFKPMSFNILDTLESAINDVNLVKTNNNEVVWKTNIQESNIYSDQSLITHIISNLISNAIKYSPNGKPVYVNLDENKESYMFMVKDSGIGIPEKDKKHLFTAFHRSANTGAIEGTGLGLSIVKQCVESLNGTINVDSKEKQGSTFTVEFPKDNSEK